MLSRSLTLLLFLSISFLIGTFGGNVRNGLPSIKIFEIRPATSTKLEAGEEEVLIEKAPNSDIIVGEDIRSSSKLIMECDARYPVQWVYSGDGTPEYSTNTTQTQTSGGITRPDNLFSASISLGFRRPISSHDSGKYTCRSLQSPDLSAYYHLYVADEKLFISSEGGTIYYKRNDKTVRIPCSVSNPKATVSLQKSVNGLVQCPLNDSISYDSFKGFQLEASRYFDPSGIYVCTAGYNNTYQVVRYTVLLDAEQNPTSRPPIQIQQEKISCTRNSDCSPAQACIQGICASPCGSACGRNTQCQVVTHSARCHCLPDHSGNPYHACYATPKPETIEKDPCNPSPCGVSTVCERLPGDLARCSCAPSFQGDPYLKCYPVQQLRDPCSPNPCGPNSRCIHRNGFTSCSCSPQFYGAPPNCRPECEINSHCPTDRACIHGRCRNPCEGACVNYHRTECRVINRQPVCATISCAPGFYGKDCLSVYTKEDGQIQVPSKPSHLYLPEALQEPQNQTEKSPCVPFPCGLNAECTVKQMENSLLNMTSDIALCQCPPEKSGNADVECYPKEEQLRTDSGPSDNSTSVPTSTVASTTTTNSNSISYDCTPDKCGINAICKERSCKCPDRHNGNPFIKCYPTFCAKSEDCDNIDSECVAGRCVDSEKKQCGLNAIRINTEQGKFQSCICPANMTGLATIACHPNTKPVNESIISVTSQTESQETTTASSACNACGKNTICTREEVCECLPSFKGDPLVGCELRCSANSDCPSNRVCHSQSSRCVDPCEPDLRPFFLQCGVLAFCKVSNHTPICYCPPSAPHGNPGIRCSLKKEEWVQSYRMPNSTCVDGKRLNCGPNSACKRFHDLERCVCIPGHFGDPTGEIGCRVGIECKNNPQCHDDQECVNGKCLSVCRHKICGPFSGCKGENHVGSCVCHIGNVFNPMKAECEPAKGALAERLLFFRSFEDV